MLPAVIYSDRAPDVRKSSGAGGVAGIEEKNPIAQPDRPAVGVCLIFLSRGWSPSVLSGDPELTRSAAGRQRYSQSLDPGTEYEQLPVIFKASDELFRRRWAYVSSS